jgi:glycosyltransferase involved in cell wall biosynthesis
MAAGRPIVASNLPAFREVLSAEEAVLVEPGSASAIAVAIERILGDEGLATRLASNAFEAAAQYSWTERARRLEQILARVVAPRDRKMA